MVSLENLDTQEDKVPETPEQEEVSRQLQEMAGNLEGGKDGKDAPDELAEINRRLAELDGSGNDFHILNDHEKQERGSLAERKKAIIEEKTARARIKAKDAMHDLHRVRSGGKGSRK